MTKLNLKKIVSISVLLTFAFYAVSNKFPELNFWKYSIVSAIIFLILYLLNFLYEKFFWNKHWIIKKLFILIGFQEYPNIVGGWEMEYFSSYKYDWDNSKYNTKGKGEIKIKKVEGGFIYSGNFDQSRFKSSSNYFEKNQNNKLEWILGYKYTNDPKETNLSQTGFVGHCGFTILNFDEDKPEEMSGFYGNDENRKTRGKIILKKKQ
ncbi:MAG: hypothetical protein RBT30_00005 [Patescibacteria group bacterium]|jgi:hypothetical protein|nr:hypothetical protein [Patescibacteria group bacterium]